MTRNSKISVGLSVMAVVGVVATAFFSAKNSKKFYHVRGLKAAEKWDDLTDEEFEEVKDEPFDSILTKKDEVIIFGKTFWPTLVAGGITIGCIVGAQVLDIREIMGLSAGLAAITYKFNDMKNYIHEKYPDKYDEVMKHVNGEAAKRAIEKEMPYKEESYDGKKRYYFPKSDQIVFMRPEDLIKVQGFISSIFGTRLDIHINEILDYIHQDLGYKDVHLCDTDYIWEFIEDDETMFVEAYHFPNIELEYDDILDDDGESIVCQVVTMSFEPRVYAVA